MSALSIVADDLTGALDAAVCFAGDGPVTVLRSAPSMRPSARIAVNLGTRDWDLLQPDHEASLALSDAVFREGDLCFKKIDSLLRGHWAQELACLWSAPGGTGRRFERIVLAPAFPSQGRTTVEARLQLAPGWAAGGFSATEHSIVDELGRQGVPARRRPLGSAWPLDDGGVTVCDAVSQRDLDAIVRCGAGPLEGTLWVGAAGLARALAERAVPVQTELALPLLLIVGSHHPGSLAQLARLRACCPEVFVPFVPLRDPAATAAGVASRLTQGRQVACLDFQLPPGMAPELVADTIRRGLIDLVPHLPRPASVFVTGGQTLADFCDGLGCQALIAKAEWAPGVVCATMADGLWRGGQVISKSGAFGGADFLAELCSQRS